MRTFPPQPDPGLYELIGRSLSIRISSSVNLSTCCFSVLRSLLQRMEDLILELDHGEAFLDFYRREPGLGWSFTLFCKLARVDADEYHDRCATIHAKAWVRLLNYLHAREAHIIHAVAA